MLPKECESHSMANIFGIDEWQEFL